MSAAAHTQIMLDSETMNGSFLPFALPDIGEDEIDEVVDSLRSGWISTGPKTKRFERDFAEFIGGGVEAIAVNSATAGLHLALEAVGVGAGDEVITTPYTFTATAEVVRYLGANPVFVDIDPETLNIDAAAIAAAITPRTRAIIPVHFAGLPADMDAILSVASEHGLRVIEDAAHSFPVDYRGEIIGSLRSDATVFSFYATKTITTGEGGMIVSRDPDLIARCKVMRLHGISRDAFDRYTSETPSWYYEVIEPGFKYNMTDIAASIGIHQLRRARAFLGRRRALAARYDAALNGLPVSLPPRGAAGSDHAFHLYVLRLSPTAPVGRDEFIAAMAREGIGCSVHFIPLHLHPYWRDQYGLRPESFPNALEAYESAVSLPLYTRMSDEDQDRVIHAIRKVLEC